MTEMPIRVKKIDMYIAPEYGSQYYRPYTTHLSGQDLVNEIQETTQNGTVLVPESLAASAGRFIRPSSSHTGEAQIANGWTNRRIIFVMEVEITGTYGETTVQYMSGYTDHPGISASMHVDPNMRLYFNSAMSFRSMMRQYGNGGVKPTIALKHATNIISPFQGAPLDQNAASHMLRPQDVVNNLHTSRFLQGVGNSGYDTNGVRDMTTAAMGDVSISRFSNGNPSEYLSGLLKAMLRTQESLETYQAFEEEKFALQSAAVKEPSMTEFNVIVELSRQLHYGGYGNDGSVSWGELISMFGPEIDAVTVVHSTNQLTPMPSAHNPLDTESTGSSTQEAIAANIVTSSLPSIMAQCMLAEMSFTITNETVGSPDPYQIIPGEHVQTIAREANFRQLANIAFSRIATEICPAVSNNNTVTFHISVMASLVRDTTVYVRLNGGPSVPFVIPTWGNSIFTPVGHSTQSNLALMASDIDYVFDKTAGGGHDFPQQPGNFGMGAQEPTHQQIYTGQESAPSPEAPATGSPVIAPHLQ